MREERLSLKPLDLSNMLKHAFLSGRDSQKGTGQTRMEAWAEYDPTENDAYLRIEAILKNFDSTRPEAAQVRVKEISWQATDYRPNYIRSDNGIATYALTTHPDDVQLSICGTGWVPYESVSEAKAAAQANYERRIRAALEPDTVTGWQDIAAKLFCALDDIDTADDIAKDNEKLYRNLVRKAHKIRFEFQDLFPDSALPPAPEKEG